MREQEKTDSARSLECPHCGSDGRITRLWMQRPRVPALVYVLASIPLGTLIAGDFLGLFSKRDRFEWFILLRLGVMLFLLLKLPKLIGLSYRMGVRRSRLCRDCGEVFVPDWEESTGELAGCSEELTKWGKLLEVVMEFNGNRRGGGRRVRRRRLEQGSVE